MVSTIALARVVGLASVFPSWRLTILKVDARTRVSSLVHRSAIWRRFALPLSASFCVWQAQHAVAVDLRTDLYLFDSAGNLGWE